MGYRSISVALVLGLVALPLSCGGDDADDDATGTGGSKGGAAGKAGNTGKGGSAAGKAGNAGKGGKAGSANGGTGNVSGSGNNGGTGNVSGSGNNGGTGNVAGAGADGGMSGTGGTGNVGNNGGQAGIGGETPQGGAGQGQGGGGGLDRTAYDAAFSALCALEPPPEENVGGAGGVPAVEPCPPYDETYTCSNLYETGGPDPTQECLDAGTAVFNCYLSQYPDGYICDTTGYGVMPGPDAATACESLRLAQIATCNPPP